MLLGAKADDVIQYIKIDHKKTGGISINSQDILGKIAAIAGVGDSTFKTVLLQIYLFSAIKMKKPLIYKKCTVYVRRTNVRLW